MPSELPGAVTARFDIQTVIARGGFGTVYLAQQRSVHRPVALKLLRHADVVRDRLQVQRFEREARATAAIQHPHVVMVYECGVDEQVPWIAYEYLPGPTLRQRMEAGPLPWAVAVGIAAQVASAIAAAHAAGVLHRDIKPENILGAGDDRYKVGDFGIARWSQGEPVRTETGVILGTPRYMAPELIEGKPEASSDVYALGAMLFEMLTGRAPFEDDNPLVVIEAHLRRAPPGPRSLVPDLPAKLEELVLACLAKSPAARPESALDLERRLRRLTAEPSRSPGARSSSSRTVVSSAVRAPAPRRRMLPFVAAIIVVAGIWIARPGPPAVVPGPSAPRFDPGPVRVELDGIRQRMVSRNPDRNRARDRLGGSGNFPETANNDGELNSELQLATSLQREEETDLAKLERIASELPAEEVALAVTARAECFIWGQRVQEMRRLIDEVRRTGKEIPVGEQLLWGDQKTATWLRRYVELVVEGHPEALAAINRTHREVENRASEVRWLPEMRAIAGRLRSELQRKRDRSPSTPRSSSSSDGPNEKREK